jgi:hypothetical protein
MSDEMIVKKEIQRYGINWTDAHTPICSLKIDGYWTPWHIAQERIEELERLLSIMWECNQDNIDLSGDEIHDIQIALGE